MKKYYAVRIVLLILTIFYISLIILCKSHVQTQTIPKDAATVALGQKLPIDPRIIVGELDNGLRYYIRENRKPEKRALLRLAVNAGSVLEDNDQLGLAHFVEHMAFNGTKRFAKQELVDFMESIGMKVGSGVNAYTTFDETVYMLMVPTDSSEVMEKAFQIMEDWTQWLTFDHKEIDKDGTSLSKNGGWDVEQWLECVISSFPSCLEVPDMPNATPLARKK